jgi:hypothetical protein
MIIMADVTGRIYEAFVEFLLRKLGYQDEWSESEGRKYLYETHPEALCHRSQGICEQSIECHKFSSQENIPYGPWYDPDFFVLEGKKPIACLHVTHWSNPRSSKYKFWRSIEDHFQYKTQYGRDLLSINLIFAGLRAGQSPMHVEQLDDILHLSGWDPAIGSIAAVSFDSCVLFPVDYEPIESFLLLLPEKLPGNTKKRRELYN